MGISIIRRNLKRNFLKGLLIGAILAAVFIYQQRLMLGIILSICVMMIFSFAPTLIDKLTKSTKNDQKKYQITKVSFVPHFLFLYSFINLFATLSVLINPTLLNYLPFSQVLFIPLYQVGIVYLLIVTMIRLKGSQKTEINASYKGIKIPLLIYLSVSILQIIIIAYATSFKEEVILMMFGVSYFIYKLYRRYQDLEPSRQINPSEKKIS